MKAKKKKRSHRYYINRPRSYDGAYRYQATSKQHLKLNL